MTRISLALTLVLLGCDAPAARLDTGAIAGDAGSILGDAGSAPDTGRDAGETSDATMMPSDAATVIDAGTDDASSPDAYSPTMPIPFDTACARLRTAFDATGCDPSYFWCLWEHRPVGADAEPSDAMVRSCEQAIPCASGCDAVNTAMHGCDTAWEPICP